MQIYMEGKILNVKKKAFSGLKAQMIISDQLLHIRLREHHQRGAEKNLREDQEICYEIMSSIYEKKVVPMKSQ